MTKILNAFSLNMLASTPANITVEPMTLDQVKAIPALDSAIGHADTAAVFAEQLGRPVPMNRATVTLAPGETVIIGQYSGPRLPEGAKALPEGATIKWLKVTVNS